MGVEKELGFEEILLILLGAVFAFILTGLLQVYQNRNKNIAYANFVISYLVSVTHELYSLKSQTIIHKKKEADEIKEFIKNLDKTTERFKVREVSKKIPFSIDTLKSYENLSFVCRYNPMIISLLINTLNSLEHLRFILKEMNDKIDVSSGGLDDNNLHYILSTVDAASNQIDRCLYLSEKAANTLIRMLDKVYNQKRYIKDLEFIEEFKKMKPNPIESYEKEEFLPDVSYFQKLVINITT